MRKPTTLTAALASAAVLMVAPLLMASPASAAPTSPPPTAPPTSPPPGLYAIGYEDRDYFVVDQRTADLSLLDADFGFEELYGADYSAVTHTIFAVFEGGDGQYLLAIHPQTGSLVSAKPIDYEGEVEGIDVDSSGNIFLVMNDDIDDEQRNQIGVIDPDTGEFVFVVTIFPDDEEEDFVRATSIFSVGTDAMYIVTERGKVLEVILEDSGDASTIEVTDLGLYETSILESGNWVADAEDDGTAWIEWYECPEDGDCASTLFKFELNAPENPPAEIGSTQADGIALDLGALFLVPTDPEIGVSTTSLHPGDQVTVTGTGFTANHEVRIELHSTPVVLGTLTANASGSFSGTFTIPPSVGAGNHAIHAFDLASGTSTSFDVQMQATLPATGFPDAAPLIGAGVLALLAGTTLLALRRRPHPTT